MPSRPESPQPPRGLTFSRLRVAMPAVLLACQNLAAPVAWAGYAPSAPRPGPQAPAKGPAPSAGLRCGEDPAQALLAKAPPPQLADQGDPRAQLRDLVQAALERSKGIGASKLLEEAAKFDVQETQAGKWPSIYLTGQLGPSYSKIDDFPAQKPTNLTANISAQVPLWDAGRLKQLVAWRVELAQSAQWSIKSAEEAVALQTVSLALDRSRYHLQVQVYRQYVQKMRCLSDAIDLIVAGDRGRASEQVQARKSMRQAELQLAQSESALRVAEIRLRRFVGDSLPSPQGFAAVFAQLPAKDMLLAETEASFDIEGMKSQARAAEAYARSVEAAQKPQVGVSVSAAQVIGPIKSTSLSAGVSYSVPLFVPGADASVSSAQKRASAQRMGLIEALEARRYRVEEVFESAESSFDRTRRATAVLGDSEELRRATLEQWRDLSKRSLFDVMSAEGDYFNTQVARVNAIYDGQQAVAMLWSLGRGLNEWLR